MKEKLKSLDETKITGFFDDGTEFNGELKFKGSFRVEGFFRGTIESESQLIIGERAKVEADVKVAHVLINGDFRGNIKASDKVEIHSRGRVNGTIQTPRLIVEEGAFLQANCQTIDAPAETAEPDLQKILES